MSFCHKPASHTRIRVEHLSKWFHVDGRLVHILDDITIEARDGEFVSVVGPSGCGKTTLFNIICGLLQADEGWVMLNGKMTESRRGMVAYMPQKDLLLPWRSVLENAVLSAEVGGQSVAQARMEALSLIPQFGLEGFAESYPHELSGGMRQRAALLRTYLFHRDLLLLDEPFGALDALTRRQMQLWLMSVWEQHRKTILFITHDVDEAIFLSDRVYVLSPRPATVRLQLEIDLPRPRAAKMLSDQAFVTLRKDLLQALDIR